jgi:drug/metabolite transporter (DMT)-like permease
MSSPSLFVIGMVLFAALMHATWNAIIKGSGDRLLALALVNAGHILTGLVLVVLYAPPAREAWGFVAASTFIHFFYYGFLLMAYRLGDFSQVYPIARGVAPVLVALGAWGFAGEVLPLQAWVAILVISGAIAVQVFGRREVNIHAGAVLAALMTGLTIATYTVVDGLGVRVSGNPLGYIGWLFVLEGFSILVLFWLGRARVRTLSLRSWVIGLTGGLLSSLAYGLAIYAKSLTTLGSVSAIRETSVVMAALIGIIWFGERPWKLRLASAGAVVAGIVLLAFS